MRTWLPWLTGFALTFLTIFVALLFYSIAQPAMWLPVAFACAFGLLLGFSSRISSTSRVGLAMIFGSLSCVLWVASGSATLYSLHDSWRTLLDVLLAVIAVFGLLVFVLGLKGSKPNLWPVLALMAMGWLISYFSSTHGGASPMVEWVMRTFGWSHDTADHVVVAFRKTVHVGFYGLVGLTGMACALKNGATRRMAIAAGLLTALTYASFDEMRQSTQADRGGSAWDVLLDMGGAGGAILAVSAISKPKRAGRPKPAAN